MVGVILIHTSVVSEQTLAKISKRFAEIMILYRLVPQLATCEENILEPPIDTFTTQWSYSVFNAIFL